MGNYWLSPLHPADGTLTKGIRWPKWGLMFSGFEQLFAVLNNLFAFLFARFSASFAFKRVLHYDTAGLKVKRRARKGAQRKRKGKFYFIFFPPFCFSK